MTEKTKPAHTVRCGLIRAAIWRNESENGPFYNATFERRFRGGDGQWKGTTGYGRDDLLALAKVADSAHTWICQQQESDKPKPPSGPPDGNGSAPPAQDAADPHAPPDTGGNGGPPQQRSGGASKPGAGAGPSPGRQRGARS
ncbi:MAG: hypothetical protein ACKVS8_11100 [Phycisphaerales bacterium]